MPSARYKVQVYDINGTFISSLSSASFAPFQRVLNEGDSTMDLSIAIPLSENSDALTLGNEFRIYKEVGSSETLIYSGQLYSYDRMIGQTGGYQTVAHIVPFSGRLAKTFLVYTGDYFNITRDGTFSADVGGLDSGKSSDQMKFIINMFRARNASTSISQETGDTAISFGNTTRLSQSFTTGTDTEKLKIAGFSLRMAYSTGTRGELDVAIRADDGTGKPTGGNLALSRIPSTVIGATRWYNVLFDTPYTATASTKYHIYLASSASSATNVYAWRSYEASNLYSGGDRVVSTDSGGTWTVQTNKDHMFKVLYVDESRVRLNYTSTSIDTSADDKDWKYTATYDKSAMNYVLRYGPSDWNYYIDASNTLHYHPTGFSKANILNSCDSASGWTSGADITGIALVTQSSILDGTVSVSGNIPTRREGSGAIKFTLGGTATAHYIYKSITSVDLSTNNNAGCWVLVPYTTQLSDLRIRLYSGANYSEWALNPGNLIYGDWNWLTPKTFIQTTPTATSGTLNLSAVDKIALVINTISSSETTVWYMDDWKAGNVEIFRATYGKNIASITYNTSIEDLINKYIISNNAAASPIQNSYQDPQSISAYMLSEANRVDGRLTVEATIDAIGNDFVIRNAFPSKTITVTVSSSDPDLPITNINPGYLLKLDGLPTNLGLGSSYFQVVSMRIGESVTDITLAEIGKETGDRVSELQQRVDAIESYAATAGDTPTITIFDE